MATYTPTPRDVVEFSEDLARPVELYVFETVGKSWKYTNADSTYVSASLGTFDAIAISRGGISQTEEMKKLAMKITAERTISLYEHFRVATPGSRVTVTIYSLHSDPDYDSEETLMAEWTGRVLGPRRSGDHVEFTCEPVYTSVKALGLRRCWQKQCPLVLYGQGPGQCNINAADYAVTATVTDTGNLTVTGAAIGGFADTYFEGGYVEWEPVIDGEAQTGMLDYRFIERHEGSEIGVTYTIYGMAVGQTVTLYPGCNHTMQMCNDRFSNILNYGGQAYIPQKNPYKGNPVY